MVIRAAELMLDRFDRRISDRYKMIDYREEDNLKRVIEEGDWIITVTLPVALSKYICKSLIFQTSRLAPILDIWIRNRIH